MVIELTVSGVYRLDGRLILCPSSWRRSHEQKNREVSNMSDPMMKADEARYGEYNVTTRYWREGSGDPVLFLHGVTGASWTPFFDELSKKVEVIYPEHPGFGETARPDWLESMEDLKYYYLDLLDAWEIERVSIVGHSIGGWLAMELAAHAPERVRNLVLVDSLGIYDPSIKLTDIFFMPYEDVGQFMFHKQELRDEWLRNLNLIEMNRNHSTIAQLGWNPRLHNPKLPERLHRVKSPVSIVWGEEDTFIPKSYVDKYCSLFPNCEVHYIPDCGHIPPVESPLALLEIVIKALNDRGGSN